MEEAITEFTSVSGTDRRTARFFLERQRGDVNNALEDYFSHPDLTIPADYMREPTSNNDENRNSDEYSYSGSENSESHSSDNSSGQRRLSFSSGSELNNEEKETSQQQENAIDTPIQAASSIIEVDSSANISSEITSISEKEENYFINDNSSFPRQKSKGKSAKVYIYSNGILLLDNFYDKSSSDEYPQILKSLQCGFLPSNLTPNDIVDIEICDLRQKNYVK